MSFAVLTTRFSGWQYIFVQAYGDCYLRRIGTVPLDNGKQIDVIPVWKWLVERRNHANRKENFKETIREPLY